MPSDSSGSEYLMKAGQLLARLDRIPVWGMAYIFLGILGMGSMFTFFDIFNINVSIIQAGSQIFGISPTNPVFGEMVASIVAWNLVGYIVGALILGPTSDRVGRRNMLMITMLITGMGSLFNALAFNYTSYLIARFVTGFGIGADLAVVNTYVSEVAPTSSRARYTSWIFVFSSIGAFLGVWLGLLFTTPPARFPYGLPFALGASGWFARNGWRLVFGIGALLSVAALLLRVELPESPRWLIAHGKMEEAERVISRLEEVAGRRIGGLPPIPQVIHPAVLEKPSYRESLRSVFGNRTYAVRWILLALMWVFAYWTVYTIAGILTTLLVEVGYASSEAGMIVAVGMFGFLMSGVIAGLLGESAERFYWIPIGAALTIVGAVVLGMAGLNLPLAFIGAAILMFAENLWVPIGYTWTAESFPTRARVTGFALADGVGHFGFFGSLLVANLTAAILSSDAATSTKSVEVLVLVALGLVVASVIAIVNRTATRGRRFEEISP
ncbi:MAG: MFS transporter [Nitrososphaeria archaeon]|jgi:MFS family permease